MPIFQPEDEERVRELLDALERPVELLVARGPEEAPLPGARDIDFGAETERVVAGLAVLSDRVTYRVEEEPPGFERYPAIAVLPEGEDGGLRYYGLPWGYELGSLIGGGASRPARASRPSGRSRSSASPRSTATSRSTSSSRRPDHIARRPCCWRTRRRSPRRGSRSSAIEATEFPALADAMDVWAVPRIIVNGVPQWDGAVPERVFLDRVLAPAFE